jgi:Domain of unknown function (DUF4468) with TBP-like fold
MKNLLFIIMLIGATNCHGQQKMPISEQDTAISYNGIINVDGVTKEELYIRARDWFSNNLRGLQIQDKETGELSGNGIVEGTITFRMLGTRDANATFNFNVHIWIKDSRYMYRLTNINNSAITYANSTTTSKDDISSPVGMLYTSEHSKVKVLGLSQKRSDETYQSAKNEFDKIAKGLIASLNSDMGKQSTPLF